MKEKPESHIVFLSVFVTGTLFAQLLLLYEMRTAAIAVLVVAGFLTLFVDRSRTPQSVRVGRSFGLLATIIGGALFIDRNFIPGGALLLLGIAGLIWTAIKINQAIVCKPKQAHVAEKTEEVRATVVPLIPEDAAMDDVVISSHQDEANELAPPSVLKPGFSYSAMTLPPDYPTPPTRWESRMAAVLLTHGKLKAFTHEMGFGENAESLVPLLSNRELAEAILDRVPHVQMAVYERVTPPLTDHPERELKDWEREMEDWHMRPMPPNEPHLPARVTAFTSHPWGRVGLFLVVFDAPEMPVRWGMWYLRQPSAKTGTSMPFFRLGDFDDAELLAWLVLKPYLDAQAVVVENLNPPASETYPGPWHKMGKTLKYREVPDWFAEVLQQQ